MELEMRTKEEIADRINSLKEEGKMHIAGTHSGWLMSEIWNYIIKLRIEELRWTLETKGDVKRIE